MGIGALTELPLNPGAARVGLHLSPGELAQVGEIMLLWGACENFLGNSLGIVFGIPFPARQDFVDALGFGRKVDLIHGRLRDDAALGRLTAELNYAKQNYRPERDTLAHGSALGDGDGAVRIEAVAKPRVVEPATLGRAVERAQFAASISMELNGRLSGVAWPLPTMPRPD